MNNQFKLKTIPKSQLLQSEAKEIISLCSEAFEEDYTPYLNSFKEPVHVLGYLDGKIVCHALWITRWLQIGNGPLLRTAYVEGVATEAATRGQGFATEVMEQLACEIVNFEIGALSPAETSLYSRLGWQYWRGPLFHRKSDELIPDPEDELVLIYCLPQTPDLDLSLPISIEWREGEVW